VASASALRTPGEIRRWHLLIELPGFINRGPIEPPRHPGRRPVAHLNGAVGLNRSAELVLIEDKGARTETTGFSCSTRNRPRRRPAWSTSSSVNNVGVLARSEAACFNPVRGLGRSQASHLAQPRTQKSSRLDRVRQTGVIAWTNNCSSAPAVAQFQPSWADCQSPSNGKTQCVCIAAAICAQRHSPHRREALCFQLGVPRRPSHAAIRRMHASSLQRHATSSRQTAPRSGSASKALRSSSAVYVKPPGR
jgi:hypothetical protein